MERGKRQKRPRAGLKWPIISSMAILISFVIVGVFAQYLAPHGYRGTNLSDSLLPPVWMEGGKPEYLLGTDMMGRDILSRIIYGARVSLIVAILSVFFAGSVGTSLGIVAGYMGGWVDTVISRVVDVMLGFPSIVLAMVFAVVLGPSIGNIIVVIALVLWALYARQARAETLKVREMDYVTLARIAGCSDLTIMSRHILPNIINSMVVLATLQIGHVILLEASLSFLGVGVPAPTPSWGSMVADGRDRLVTAWWISGFSGVPIVLVVLAGNLFGDWLRDKLDPKLRAL